MVSNLVSIRHQFKLSGHPHSNRSLSVSVPSMAIALANQKIEVLHPDVLDSGVGLRVEAIASTNSLGTRLPMLSLTVPSSHMKTNS